VASAWSVALLLLPVDPDYTAGELADHLRSWMEGAALYPSLEDGPPFRVLNYPPLVLALARLVAGTGIDLLAAGRLTNLAGLVVLVGIVAAWARDRGARGHALAGTVGLLGTSFPVLYAAGQLHIELWAAAGTLGGFWLLHRSVGAAAEVRGRRWALPAAGVALALACLAKQTQVVPALVGLAWVGWHGGGRRAIPAAAAFALTGAMGSLVILLAFGEAAWTHMVVYTVGTYSLTNLGLQMASHLLPWAVLLAAAGWLVVAGRRGRGAADPLVWLWVGSLAWTLSAARVGSSYPYFLDLHLATVLLVGPRLFAPGARADLRALGPRWVRPLLALQVVGASLVVGVVLLGHIRAQHRLAEALPRICDALGTRDPVVVGSPGLAVACGRQPLLHPFIMSSLAAQGRWNPEDTAEGLAAGDFGPAVLPFDPRDGFPGAQADRWHPRLQRAIRSGTAVEPLPAGRWKVSW